MSDRAFLGFQEDTRKYSLLQDLLNFVKQGWPDNVSNITPHLKPYLQFKEEIWESRGLIWKGDRVIVPRSLRPNILKLIHEGHLGMEKCKLRARQSFFWPGLNNDVENVVRRCDACQRIQNNLPREKLLQHELSAEPFEKVGMDFFQFKGNNYLVITDYFSNYPDVCFLKDTSTKTLLEKVKACFARFGIPKIIISDGGPQFRSYEFKQFVHSWDIKHVMSSPHYPKGNGPVFVVVVVPNRHLAK